MDSSESAKIDKHAKAGGREGELDRFDVGLRALYSVLFSAVLSVLQSITALIVIYQLIYSAITKSLPSDRVQGFANGVVAYFYQILRYLTHNDSLIPFPFSDFPDPVDPTRAAYAERTRVDSA